MERDGQGGDQGEGVASPAPALLSPSSPLTFWGRTPAGTDGRCRTRTPAPVRRGRADRGRPWLVQMRSDGEREGSKVLRDETVCQSMRAPGGAPLSAVSPAHLSLSSSLTCHRIQHGRGRRLQRGHPGQGPARRARHVADAVDENKHDAGGGRGGRGRRGVGACPCGRGSCHHGARIGVCVGARRCAGRPSPPLGAFLLGRANAVNPRLAWARRRWKKRTRQARGGPPLLHAHAHAHAQREAQTRVHAARDLKEAPPSPLSPTPHIFLSLSLSFTSPPRQKTHPPPKPPPKLKQTTANARASFAFKLTWPPRPCWPGTPAAGPASWPATPTAAPAAP